MRKHSRLGRPAIAPSPLLSESFPRERFPKNLSAALAFKFGYGPWGYHLGSAEIDQAAMEIVAKAFDHGVRFFDNAWKYRDGLSEERLGKALRGERDQAFVMTKVCREQHHFPTVRELPI